MLTGSEGKAERRLREEGANARRALHAHLQRQKPQRRRGTTAPQAMDKEVGEKRLEHAERTAKTLAAHQARKAAEEAERAEEIANERLVERQARARDHEEGAERVEARRGELEQRAERDRSRREAEQAREQERLERLERERAPSPSVERSAERAMAPTASFKAEPVKAEPAQLFPVRGFTEAEIQRDERVRLIQELGPSGLLNTEAGRAAFASAKPAKAPCSHMQSTL